MDSTDNVPVNRYVPAEPQLNVADYALVLRERMSERGFANTLGAAHANTASPLYVMSETDGVLPLLSFLPNVSPSHDGPRGQSAVQQLVMTP